MAGKHYSSAYAAVKSRRFPFLFTVTLILLALLFYVFTSSSSSLTLPTAMLAVPDLNVDYSFVSSLEKFLANSESSSTRPDDSVRDDANGLDVKLLDDLISKGEEERLLGDGSSLFSSIRVYVYNMPSKFTYGLLWLFRNTYRETSNLTSNGSPVHRLIEQVGATIVDQSVTIALEPNYVLPSAAPASFAAPTDDNARVDGTSPIQKAEDVVSSMLAKGFILGKDAVSKAKAFDEKHQLISTAAAKVASLDQKIGLSEKITSGATIVSDKVKELDQKFLVTEKTKSALAVAEQGVSSAGSAIMKNRYILTATTWAAGAFSRVTKAAGEVGEKTIEKVLEEEHGRNVPEGYAPLQSGGSPKGCWGSSLFSSIRVYVYNMPSKFTYDLLWLFRNTYRETSNLTSNGSPVHRLIEQGATIVDQSVTIALEPNYVLPSAAPASFAASTEDNARVDGTSPIQKAEDVVSSMLAKGFILGKDAVSKAKAFDEKHQLISTAAAKVASLDQKIGLSEKITSGATIVSDKVKEVDQKFLVTEKTKSALAVAEQKFLVTEKTKYSLYFSILDFSNILDFI